MTVQEHGKEISPEDAWALIEETVFDTIGCTEPVAIALAAARAFKALRGVPEKVRIELSANVFKNAMAVGIPGSDQKGIRYAVALGLVKGKPELGLTLFALVTPQDAEKALHLMQQLPVEVTLSDENKAVFIRLVLHSDNGSAEIIVEGAHDSVSFFEVNGKPQKINTDDDRGHTKKAAGLENRDLEDLLISLSTMDIQDIVALAESVPEDSAHSLIEGVTINERAAHEGLLHKSGMGYGAALSAMIKEGILGESIISTVKMMAAAGSDARMGGALIPVKGCGGSGNHGIAFFLTVGLTLNMLESRLKKPLSRSLALGLLMVQYIKVYTGLLTPICGVTVCAAAAAAVALVYGLGGSAGQMLAAVKLVDGNIAGILCDGAKHGCALKVATSAGASIEAAFAALSDVSIPDTDGIVGVTLKDGLSNIRRLQNDGMTNADKTVLSLLLEKERSGLFGC